MHTAIQHIATEMSWRVKALMKARRFYGTSSLLRLYKAQILTYVECFTAAIAHAAPYLLDKIDATQRHFLSEIGLSELDALKNFSLAGLIHRSARFDGPPHYQTLFPRMSSSQNVRVTRTSACRHQLQIEERFVFNSTDVIQRSAFGLVKTYNALPVKAVAASVKALQSQVQHAVLRFAEREPMLSWSSLLRSATHQLSVASFQALF